MNRKIAILLILLFSAYHSQDIVINEIMYNPGESGTDTTEYVELVNSLSVPINISNWSFITRYCHKLRCIFIGGEG
jgi:hypothetical protein